MQIQADKRQVTASPDEAAETRLIACAKSLRSLQIQAAKDLAKVESAGHHRLRGCASLVEFGVRVGFGAFETRQLANLGMSLAAEPELEAMVRKGEIALSAAAIIGRIYANPGLLRPDDSWLEHARTEPVGVLRKRVQRRIEEHAQGRRRMTEVSVYVPDETHAGFRRARALASRKAGRTLTQGQTLTAVVGFYLERNDPLLQLEGKRRVGPTDQTPASRYIPAEVRRAVRRRSNDCCEVPGCQNAIHLQFAHRSPHRDGSGREAEDLIHLCSAHHLLYDAGMIDLSGVLLSDGPLSDGPLSAGVLSGPKHSKAGQEDRVQESRIHIRASRHTHAPARDCQERARRATKATRPRILGRHAANPTRVASRKAASRKAASRDAARRIALPLPLPSGRTRGGLR